MPYQKHSPHKHRNPYPCRFCGIPYRRGHGCRPKSQENKPIVPTGNQDQNSDSDREDIQTFATAKLGPSSSSSENTNCKSNINIDYFKIPPPGLLTDKYLPSHNNRKHPNLLLFGHRVIMFVHLAGIN